MSAITNHEGYSVAFDPPGQPVLKPWEIDSLLTKLTRGQLSTFQEEYEDLKKALVS